ncbi:unnamed protein product [Camellia sinensis]
MDLTILDLIWWTPKTIQYKIPVITTFRELDNSSTNINLGKWVVNPPCNAHKEISPCVTKWMSMLLSRVFVKVAQHLEKFNIAFAYDWMVVNGKVFLTYPRKLGWDCAAINGLKTCGLEAKKYIS